LQSLARTASLAGQSISSQVIFLFEARICCIMLPPGAAYFAANTHLQKHLATESYSTYFKLLCLFEPFMLKAFTPLNVRSALLLGGFAGFFYYLSL